MAAALACGQDVHVLVAGHQAGGAAKDASQVAGVSKVIHVDAPHLEHQLVKVWLHKFWPWLLSTAIFLRLQRR